MTVSFSICLVNKDLRQNVFKNHLLDQFISHCGDRWLLFNLLLYLVCCFEKQLILVALTLIHLDEEKQSE